MKKQYAVLNRILHGIGRQSLVLGPGDTIELDDTEDTTQDLLRTDFIEDPDHPKDRTPDEKATLEKRQIAGAQLGAPSSAAARSERATNQRTQLLEEKILGGSATEAEKAEAERIAKAKAADPEDKKPVTTSSSSGNQE